MRATKNLNVWLSLDEYEVINQPFCGDEVYCVLCDMGLTKALGLDGFPTIFYQKFLGIVGHKITFAILGVLNSGSSVALVNSTNLVLIPKKKNPKFVVNYRFISLCNMIYKLVMKTIMNRLKKYLPYLISH